MIVKAKLFFLFLALVVINGSITIKSVPPGDFTQIEQIDNLVVYISFASIDRDLDNDNDTIIIDTFVSKVEGDDTLGHIANLEKRSLFFNSSSGLWDEVYNKNSTYLFNDPTSTGGGRTEAVSANKNGTYKATIKVTVNDVSRKFESDLFYLYVFNQSRYDQLLQSSSTIDYYWTRSTDSDSDSSNDQLIDKYRNSALYLILSMGLLIMIIILVQNRHNLI